MKTFVKVFFVSFLCFFVSASFGVFASLKKNDMDIGENIGFGHSEKQDFSRALVNKLEKEPKSEESFSTLDEAIKNSSRINFLILGMEDTRTDTILLASFNEESKKADIVSIPRDTYIHRKGYGAGDQRKINAVYGSHGVDGIKQTVSYILDDIPVHHYAMIDYDGVIKIIDLFGGVEVDVPFDMKYVDDIDDPPLNINIKKGRQILDGKNALDFMRWRKNNDNNGYIDGDLGRIKAQQQVLDSLSKKISENLLTVITRGYHYVDTDIGIMDLISYGKNAIGMEKGNISFYTLPGQPDYRPINKKIYSYYVYNQKEVKAMLEDIYNVKKQWRVKSEELRVNNEQWTTNKVLVGFGRQSFRRLPPCGVSLSKNLVLSLTLSS